MKTFRLVPLVAAGLALVAAATPAPAVDNSISPMSMSGGAVAAAARAEAEATSAILGTWVQATPIPGLGLVRYAHAQCIGEDRFYVISGVAAGALTTQNLRYDATTNSWTTLAPIPAGKEAPAGVCYQGKIYVITGALAGGAPTNSFFIYDIATNTWAPGPPAPRASWLSVASADAGKVYLISGNFPGVPTVNVYDIAANAWIADAAPIPQAVISPGIAQLGSLVYIVGGWHAASPGSNNTATQRFDMATNTWTQGPVYTSGRADQAVAATRTALYSIGGDTPGGTFFDSSAVVERLDLSAWPMGTWTAADNLPSPRTGHKGGYCTEAFFPATGEVWSTGGITPPGNTFTTTNQYLQAEACPSLFILDPVALAVDAAGNGVLEPAEPAVVVAPSWMNGGAAAIASLTGAATNFTGPTGPTYTLDDAAADYGTVAAGGTNSCASTGNCYAVTVTAATRPAIHWDSQVTETLTPSGVTKDWTLHVGASFDDVSTASPFYRFIERLLHHGVTGGCNATGYCPLSNTSREQMAVFVLVAKEGAGYTPTACVPPNLFSDVPETSPFCRFIEELANRNVVTGCGPNLYCPTANVTREQMSIFVLRTLDPALNPPACVAGSEAFTDVPASNPFCRWVEELARRGVVTGCAPNLYCPTAPVTREQMGVFISVTFGLTLYGP